MQKIAKQKITSKELMLASILDGVRMLIWMQSEDGRRNRNRPQSVARQLMEEPDAFRKVEAFDSKEAFEAEWAKYTGGGG